MVDEDRRGEIRTDVAGELHVSQPRSTKLTHVKAHLVTSEMRQLSFDARYDGRASSRRTMLEKMLSEIAVRAQTGP